MLTSATVADLCDISPTTLTEWVDRGLVVPAVPGGKGRGNTRRFGLMQVVGLVVASRVLRSERGCHVSYVGKIVTGFERLTEAELLVHFRKGRTHLLGAFTQGAFEQENTRVELIGPIYDDLVDVETVYHLVKSLDD